MSNFRSSFCDPLKPDIIELGSIAEDSIISAFENIQWEQYLEQMENAEEVYYSPSLEIENSDTKHGLSISAVGQPGKFEFYIFYKRPKLVKTKSLFGSKEKLDENYLTDIQGQTMQDAIDCLNALKNHDTAFLDNKIR